MANEAPYQCTAEYTSRSRYRPPPLDLSNISNFAPPPPPQQPQLFSSEYGPPCDEAFLKEKLSKLRVEVKKDQETLNAKDQKLREETLASQAKLSELLEQVTILKAAEEGLVKKIEELNNDVLEREAGIEVSSRVFSIETGHLNREINDLKTAIQIETSEKERVKPELDETLRFIDNQTIIHNELEKEGERLKDAIIEARNPKPAEEEDRLPLRDMQQFEQLGGLDEVENFPFNDSFPEETSIVQGGAQPPVPNQNWRGEGGIMNTSFPEYESLDGSFGESSRAVAPPQTPLSPGMQQRPASPPPSSGMQQRPPSPPPSSGMQQRPPSPPPSSGMRQRPPRPSRDSGDDGIMDLSMGSMAGYESLDDSFGAIPADPNCPRPMVPMLVRRPQAPVFNRNMIDDGGIMNTSFPEYESLDGSFGASSRAVAAPQAPRSPVMRPRPTSPRRPNFGAGGGGIMDTSFGSMDGYDSDDSFGGAPAVPNFPRAQPPRGPVIQQRPSSPPPRGPVIQQRPPSPPPTSRGGGGGIMDTSFGSLGGYESLDDSFGATARGPSCPRPQSPSAPATVPTQAIPSSQAQGDTAGRYAMTGSVFDPNMPSFDGSEDEFEIEYDGVPERFVYSIGPQRARSPPPSPGMCQRPTSPPPSPGMQQRVPTPPSSPVMQQRVPTPPSSPVMQQRVPTPPSSPVMQQRLPTPPSSPVMQQRVPTPPSSPVMQQRVPTPPSSPVMQQRVPTPPSSPVMQQRAPSPPPSPPGSGMCQRPPSPPRPTQNVGIMDTSMGSMTGYESLDGSFGAASADPTRPAPMPEPRRRPGFNRYLIDDGILNTSFPEYESLDGSFGASSRAVAAPQTPRSPISRARPPTSFRPQTFGGGGIFDTSIGSMDGYESLDGSFGAAPAVPNVPRPQPPSGPVMQQTPSSSRPPTFGGGGILDTSFGSMGGYESLDGSFGAAPAVTVPADPNCPRPISPPRPQPPVRTRNRNVDAGIMDTSFPEYESLDGSFGATSRAVAFLDAPRSPPVMRQRVLTPRTPNFGDATGIFDTSIGSMDGYESLDGSFGAVPVVPSRPAPMPAPTPLPQSPVLNRNRNDEGGIMDISFPEYESLDGSFGASSRPVAAPQTPRSPISRARPPSSFRPQTSGGGGGGIMDTSFGSMGGYESLDDSFGATSRAPSCLRPQSPRAPATVPTQAIPSSQAQGDTAGRYAMTGSVFDPNMPSFDGSEDEFEIEYDGVPERFVYSIGPQRARSPPPSPGMCQRPTSPPPSPGMQQRVPTPPSSPVRQQRVPTPPSSPVMQQRAPTPPSSPVMQQRVPTPPSSPVMQQRAPTPPSSPVMQQRVPTPPSSPVMQQRAPTPPSSPVMQQRVLTPPSSPVMQQRVPTPPSSPVMQQRAPSPPPSPPGSGMCQRPPSPPRPSQNVGIMDTSMGSMTGYESLDGSFGAASADPTRPTPMPEPRRRPAGFNRYLIDDGILNTSFPEYESLDGSFGASSRPVAAPQTPRSPISRARPPSSFRPQTFGGGGIFDTSIGSMDGYESLDGSFGAAPAVPNVPHPQPPSGPVMQQTPSSSRPPTFGGGGILDTSFGSMGGYESLDGSFGAAPAVTVPADPNCPRPISPPRPQSPVRTRNRNVDAGIMDTSFPEYESLDGSFGATSRAVAFLEAPRSPPVMRQRALNPRTPNFGDASGIFDTSIGSMDGYESLDGSFSVAPAVPNCPRPQPPPAPTMQQSTTPPRPPTNYGIMDTSFGSMDGYESLDGSFGASATVPNYPRSQTLRGPVMQQSPRGLVMQQTPRGAVMQRRTGGGGIMDTSFGSLGGYESLDDSFGAAPTVPNCPRPQSPRAPANVPTQPISGPQPRGTLSRQYAMTGSVFDPNMPSFDGSEDEFEIEYDGVPER